MEGAVQNCGHGSQGWLLDVDRPQTMVSCARQTGQGPGWPCHSHSKFGCYTRAPDQFILRNYLRRKEETIHKGCLKSLWENGSTRQIYFGGNHFEIHAWFFFFFIAHIFHKLLDTPHLIEHMKNPAFPTFRKTTVGSAFFKKWGLLCVESSRNNILIEPWLC